MSRMLWRIVSLLILVGVVGAQYMLIGDFSQGREGISIIGACVLMCLFLFDRRHRKPYWQYAIVASIVIYGSWACLGVSISLPTTLVIGYGLLLVCVLLGWMLVPTKRRTAPIVIFLVLGVILVAPWNWVILTPDVLIDGLVPIEIERERKQDDESVILIEGDTKRRIGSKQNPSINTDSITIQYAAKTNHKNDMIIKLNNMTILAIEPQSTIELSQKDNNRNIKVQGWVKRRGKGVGMSAEYRDENLKKKYDKLMRRVYMESNDIRPSTWTHTSLGTFIIEKKLKLLDIFDSKYTKQIETLYEYECLIYGSFCDNVSPKRKKNSLEQGKRDKKLQETLQRAGAKIGHITQEVIHYFLQ